MSHFLAAPHLCRSVANVGKCSREACRCGTVPQTGGLDDFEERLIFRRSTPGSRTMEEIQHVWVHYRSSDPFERGEIRPGVGPGGAADSLEDPNSSEFDFDEDPFERELAEADDEYDDDGG